MKFLQSKVFLHWKSMLYGIVVSVGSAFIELVTDFDNFTPKRAMYCVVYGIVTFIIKYQKTDKTVNKTEITDAQGNTASIEKTVETTPIQ